MFTAATRRPRNVNTLQAASILYGDWGTSKAYVIGLAFAAAGFSSVWLIGLVSLLSLLIGINYMAICRLYPSGGGVYTAVRQKSESLALVGAFFLIADYLVTAALSALSALNYLGLPHPALWAMGAIAIVGLLNYLGPRHTGNFAFLIAVPTVSVVILLALFSIPHIPAAIHAVKPLHGGFWINWNHFVSVIVALSGIEAIANTTGVMKLNPGTTWKNPGVTRTSTPALLVVMIEVAFFTTLFSLVTLALPGLTPVDGEVQAPGHPNVRDALLRYMGEVYAGDIFGSHFGLMFGIVVSAAFGALLLSAVNTAIVALTSLLFVMSREGELPKQLQKVNSFGVPLLPLLVATTIPMALIASVQDVPGLADLYAVGFVGAIATNLGATCLDRKSDLRKWERGLMFGTFVLMAAIEATLFIEKAHARAFVITVLAIGLFLKMLSAEYQRSLWKEKTADLSNETESEALQAPKGATLVAVTHPGKTLDYAIHDQKRRTEPLVVLFLREQLVITDEDKTRHWLEDPGACEVFEYAKAHVSEGALRFLYMVSDSIAASIVDTAQRLHVSRVVVGMPRQSRLILLIQGDIMREVSHRLPRQIDLIIVS